MLNMFGYVVCLCQYLLCSHISCGQYIYSYHSLFNIVLFCPPTLRMLTGLILTLTGFFSRFTVFGLYSCCQGSHLAFSFNSIDGFLFCIFGFVFLLNEFRYCLFMSCCRHLSFGFLSYWASLLSIFTFTLASPIVMISAFLCSSLEWRSSYERFLSPSLDLLFFFCFLVCSYVYFDAFLVFSLNFSGFRLWLFLCIILLWKL